MSKHTTRHYCRNTHCRAKLAAPVDNEHHAFCTSGCHAIFYRHRCLDDRFHETDHIGCHHRFLVNGISRQHPNGPILVGI
jgi:hypothetical protein